MRFSIILPVRNGGNYVKECISSILNQTLGDFNCIVLDNNSTDGTVEWISSLNDPRILIHRSGKDLTIEQNWSRIKDIAKNEFITLIGHDDLLHPHYLREMADLIGKHPKATLYQAHFTYIDSVGKPVRACLPMDEVQNAHEFLACQFTATIDSTGTGYMMRSADYDKAGGIPPHYPNLIYADYDLWIRLMSLGYKATSQGDCFSYRVHESLSRTTNGMLYQEAFGKYVAFLKDLIPQNDQVHRVIIRYGQEMLLRLCEAMAHRLLKTPVQQRKLKVRDLVRIFDTYAKELIPGQDFRPLEKSRIRIAYQLDRSAPGRGLFHLFKKFSSGFK